MRLALEEIVSNIIRYGYEDDKEHHINKPFKERQKGGVGIFLLHRNKKRGPWSATRSPSRFYGLQPCPLRIPAYFNGVLFFLLTFNLKLSTFNRL